MVDLFNQKGVASSCWLDSAVERVLCNRRKLWLLASSSKKERSDKTSIYLMNEMAKVIFYRVRKEVTTSDD